MSLTYWLVIDCEIRVLLWSGQDRGHQGAEEPVGREGRQSRGDVPSGSSRAPGVHHHDRGLRVLLHCRQDLAGGPRGRGQRQARRTRAGHRQALRRPRKPSPGIRPQRCGGVHARHDGHRPEPRDKRDDAGSPRQTQRQPPLRLGLLPPVHADVRRRCDGSPASRLRAGPPVG